MLALIRTLGPVAAMLIGMGGGGALTTAISAAGFWAWNNWVENPRIIEVEQAKTALLVELALKGAAIQQMLAVEAAKEAERERQRQVIADALEGYREAVAMLEGALRDAEARNEQEITDHEAELEALGQRCPLTDADFEWLRKERFR